MKRYLLFLLICICGKLSAQSDTLAFNKVVGRLQMYGDSLLKSNNDSIRQQAHLDLSALLDSTLRTEAGSRLSFHQIKGLSIAESDDEKVKTITWMLSLERGSKYSYYGYLLLRSERKMPWKIVQLQMNNSYSNEELEFAKTDTLTWHGCIYYNIHHERYKKKDHYLLLGWAPQSVFTTRKIAEPLVYSPSKISLGAPVIKAGGKARTRLLFEYNSRVTMSLRYNESMKMIVMDHLASSDPRPEAKGMYQLYGPDLSYDGLKFNKGQWQLVKDIDVRN